MIRYLDELWIDATEEKLEVLITQYLTKMHPEYKELKGRLERIWQQYPKLDTIFDDSEEIVLSKEEHQALNEFIQNDESMTRFEKEYYFYYGQARAIEYFLRLKNLKSFIKPDEDSEKIKKEITDLFVLERVNEAVRMIEESDPEYQKYEQKVRETAERYEKLKLSHDTHLIVDRYQTAMNESYGCLLEKLYRAGMKDTAALLK